MSFGKNRKSSGMILTGVVLSSSTMSAMNQGMVSANETLGNLKLTAAGAAKKGLDSSGKVSMQGMPLKYIGYFAVAVVLILGAYGLYKYFTSEEDVKYNMWDLFCKEEGPKFFSEIKKKL